MFTSGGPVRLMPGKAGWPCCIYFVQADADPPLIKIGATKNINRRVAGLRAQSPVQLRLLGYFSGHPHDEIVLHQLFAEYRHHGEWFHPVPELLAIVNQHADALTGDVHAAHHDQEHAVVFLRSLDKRNAKDRATAAAEPRPRVWFPPTTGRYVHR